MRLKYHTFSFYNCSSFGGVISWSVFLFIGQRYGRLLVLHILTPIGFRINLPLSFPASVFTDEKICLSKSLYLIVALETKNDRHGGWRMKKKVAVMRNERKILKQNSLPSGIIIKLGLGIAVVALCAWIVTQMSINTSVITGLIGGYLIICLVFKIVKLFIKMILSIIAFIILISIFLFLIF